MDIFAILLIFGLVFSNIACYACENSNNFNVLDYGAVSNAYTDNSKAFLKAWNATCSTTTENPTLIIPERNTFLVHPVVFSGPCKAKNITFLISGRIIAPTSPISWTGLDPSKWLAFHRVSGLRVTGSGRINGRGSSWWNQSCRDHPGLERCTTLAPTALNFLYCNGTSISNLHFTNSSQTHLLIYGCHGVNIYNLTIKAPEASPNTDGIHIQSSHNVIIKRSRIGTGDDCISIGDRTSNVHISYVTCGPGHGISIGSLGREGNFVQVENIHVSTVYFQGTTNGARIKTWQVGKGYVRGVTFENLGFDSVKNPIIIDQNYCNVRGACKELQTGVQISNVTYNYLFGTSSTNVAINLNCSRSVACTGVTLQSIFLASDKPGQEVTSNCINAHGNSNGLIEPGSCLKN